MSGIICYGMKVGINICDFMRYYIYRNWTWGGHDSRTRDNPWTLRITWKPYEGKDLEEDRRDGGEAN